MKVLLGVGMKFSDNFGVFICAHVFKESLPVLEGIRDPDGDWQFFCGKTHDFEIEEPHLVGVGHLISSDGSIEELAKLQKGERATRSSENEPWVVSSLDEC